MILCPGSGRGTNLNRSNRLLGMVLRANASDVPDPNMATALLNNHIFCSGIHDHPFIDLHHVLHIQVYIMVVDLL